MKHISTFSYVVKQGVKSILRNKVFSLASIATMSACIFLFGVFFAIVQNFQYIVKEAETSVAVTVFFEPEITQERIDSIGAAIKKRVEVSKVDFESAEMAWNNYKKIYFEGSEEMAEGFADDNPLANAANYQIYMNDVSMQPSLVTYLESIDGVRRVNKSEIASNILTDFNRLMGYISIGIIGILLLVAIFLINNTITVGIGVRKEEIAIMKLIGATDFFVKAPFIVEGILIGFLGSLIPLIILYVLYDRIVIYISSTFQFLNQILTFLSTERIFSILTPVALLLGVGIGFIGSMMTIRKHLNV
jgi:cell division transport system permease protein